MAIEIEKKFLLKNDAWRSQVSRSVRMSQGYLNEGMERSIRVRIAGDQAHLNIKALIKGAGTTGVHRLEYEYEIPLADAEQILDEVAQKPIVEKTRHYVEADGFTWEIDEFAGENAGLIVAEIELLDEHANFPIPDWLGEEVSSDLRYYNTSLQKHPYGRWAST